MSEYQYYEFQAVDRALGAAQRAHGIEEIRQAVLGVHPRIEASRASRAVAPPVSSFAESPHDLTRRSESRCVAGLSFGSSLSRAS
jgi:hypothetical protein